MIRTVIEVQGESEREFDSRLTAALDRIGFEPKRSASDGAYMAMLHAALKRKGLDPQKLVEEYKLNLEEHGT